MRTCATAWPLLLASHLYLSRDFAAKTAILSYDRNDIELRGRSRP
jgi:hypothetical protein